MFRRTLPGRLKPPAHLKIRRILPSRPGKLRRTCLPLKQRQPLNRQQSLHLLKPALLPPGLPGQPHPHRDRLPHRVRHRRLHRLRLRPPRGLPDPRQRRAPPLRQLLRRPRLLPRPRRQLRDLRLLRRLPIRRILRLQKTGAATTRSLSKALRNPMMKWPALCRRPLQRRA